VFHATEAVFDDPQQALDYAAQHPLQEDVVREIDDLVSKALGEVPGGEATAETEVEHGQFEAQQFAAEESAFDSEAIERPAQADAEEWLPEAEEIPQQESEPDIAASEPLAAADSEDWIPEDQPVVSEEVEEVFGQRTSADMFVDETFEETASPQADRIIDDIVLESIQESEAYPAIRADTDCYAQPVSAEFRAQEAPISDKSELSATLLLEDLVPIDESRMPWGAVAACLLLILGLIGQYAYFESYRLGSKPGLRAAMELFCGQLKCDLPLRRDLASMEIVERAVRDHPSVDDALLINATFVNRASFPQVYPVVQVSFSNISGTPVQMRRFLPEEYLPGGQQPEEGLLPGEQAQLVLEVMDPGASAVSFQFDFM
jgi:hypothetical protein